MPGYDPDTRRVLLTRNLEITSQGNRPVGFLGRAHPLVRRALDRVRSLSYGADGQDHRISAVRAPVREPELLVTFLGRVASRSGTELERVLAVRAGRGTDPRVVASSEEWISSAAPGQGIRPSDLWKRYYAEWAEPARERCGWTAAYFRASAESFVETKKKLIGGERRELEAWLGQRAHEIAGEPGPTEEQAELFGAGQKPAAPPPVWVALQDPLERLAGFATGRVLA